MSCNIKVFDVPIIKEFFASFKDFLPIAFKPGVGKPTEDPAVLQKNLVAAMWVIIIGHAFNIVYWTLAKDPVQGVYLFVANSALALLYPWLTWFAYVKREPNCFFFLIICVEDWKFQHLLWGVFSLLFGVQNAMQGVRGLLASVKLLSGVNAAPLTAVFGFIFSGIVFVGACIMILVAVSLIKIGGKKAGIEIPDPAAAVGKTEEANPAESA
jgi:hypothetical protein